MTKFKKNKYGANFILNGEDFHISYNPCPGEGIPIFMADNGGDETALVKDGEFFILNGDFRGEYEKAIDKGYDACFAVYENHREECESSWSN